MTEQARRERRIWTALIVGGVVVVIIAGVLGWGVMSKRLESAKQLDQAIILVESADASVIAIDEVIRAEVTPEVGQKALELEPTVAPTAAKLTEAVNLLNTAYPNLNNAERKKADLLKKTANAKLDMLEQAPVILSANVVRALTGRLYGKRNDPRGGTRVVQTCEQAFPASEGGGGGGSPRLVNVKATCMPISTLGDTFTDYA